MLIIKGEIKTAEVRSCRYNAVSNKMEVEFGNGKLYSYDHSIREIQIIRMPTAEKSFCPRRKTPSYAKQLPYLSLHRYGNCSKNPKISRFSSTTLLPSPPSAQSTAENGINAINVFVKKPFITRAPDSTRDETKRHPWHSGIRQRPSPHSRTWPEIRHPCPHRSRYPAPCKDGWAAKAS